MKSFSLFFISALLAIAQFGCEEDALEFELGNEFQISTSETVTFKNEDFNITFTQVIEDSVCRPDTVCVWEGRLVIDIEVNHEDAYTLGSREEAMETEHTYPTAISHDGYLIEFLSIKRLAEDEFPYTVVLRVTKT